MEHAKLSPSDAERWTHCPGSVEAAAGLDRGSEAADQGSACHLLLARRLRGDASPPAGGRVMLVDEESGATRLVEVTPEMERWVDEVEEGVAACLKAAPEAVLRVETLSLVGRYYGRPADLFGHADVAVVAAKELLVLDAKFGRVEVEVEENPQLTLYAVGLAEEYGWQQERYGLVVHQPRSARPVKAETLTRAQLRDRAERLRPLVEAALRPGAPLVPGEWCRRCPAAGTCRALQERAQEQARRAFSDPRRLSPEELAAILTEAPLVRAALDEAEHAALRALALGRDVPGWKRVAGQGRRRWADEGEAERAMRALGLDPWRRALLSPNQAEETLGARGGLLTPLAPKVPGQPTLAREDDERPALPPDFSPTNEE